MKASIVRFVKIVKNIVTLVCAALAVFSMIALVFAFSGYLGFIILAPIGIVAFLVVYGFYAVKFSLDVVLGVEMGAQTMLIKTKRKTFTYGLGDCVSVKEYDKKYVCTFQTQDSSDRFTFLKRAPFSKPYEEGFTEEDIQKIYPQFAEEEGADHNI